ncbi:MAG: 50S ribosomal protein L3 [Gammaproteobacteria bacterium]
MAVGLVGRKLGMTRIFSEEGENIPVSVIEVLPNLITQVKTPEKEGYAAIQITTGQVKASKVDKPSAGHFAKANVDAGRGLWEFTVDSSKLEDLQVGSALTVDLFKVDQMVDVTGITKGRGFSGVVRRHGFRTQDATHGNSVSHRVHGSVGQNQTPGRVFKGKRMAGQYGAVKRTIQNLKIVAVDAQKNLLLVRGAIPGAPKGDVIIRAAVKSKVQEAAA